MRRSPEARLAGRIFDADKIVKPLLGSAAEDFYVSVQKQWEWNSRYWEQRALLAADTDLHIALQYARYAVAIEFHPFSDNVGQSSPADHGGKSCRKRGNIRRSL